MNRPSFAATAAVTAMFALAVILLAMLAPGGVLSAVAADVKAARPAVDQPAAQSGDWRQEFNSVCSQTGQSAALSEAQLKALIQRCDILEKRIGQEPDASAKKVYLRRLKTCRGMYSFSLQSKHK